MTQFFRYTLLIAAFALFLIGCADKEAEQGREQAFKDYRDFVSEVEFDAERDYSEAQIRAMEQAEDDDMLWEAESADISLKYDDYKKKVVENIELYSEEEQQEFQELEDRYNTAYQKQETRFKDASHRYRLRKELLGIEIQADDLSQFGANDLPEAYTRFVDNIETRVSELEGRDWELIEGWWLALNNRKRSLENELSEEAMATIDNATEKYQKLTLDQG